MFLSVPKILVPSASSSKIKIVRSCKVMVTCGNEGHKYRYPFLTVSDRFSSLMYMILDIRNSIDLVKDTLGEIKCLIKYFFSFNANIGI